MIELEVWLHPDTANNIKHGYVDQKMLINSDTPPVNGVRAKLLIEMQEPKIEVTPSMIEKAWKAAEWGTGVDNFRANMIQILFKGK